MELTDQARAHYQQILDELSEAAATFSPDAYLAFIEALHFDIQEHFHELRNGRKPLLLIGAIRKQRDL